jgi:flagellar M-ring protein FliF
LGLNERLQQWWSRLTPFLDKYSRAQKRNIAIAVIAGLVCLIVILWMVLRPHYVTVMTGLDNKSLGEVQTQLQTLKIPNKIQGSSVEVPANQADTARVQLAMAGLPKSGYIGYGSISNSFGMTKDQFDIQVLNALQKSLNQTIDSINGVEAAQVHIVMPQQQLFVSQNTSDAKASVFVQLGNGVQLSPAQVAGIQQLVAHSVKGLTTANVTVVDQNGVTLSSAPGSALGLQSSVSGELAYRQQLEQSLTTRLTTGLNQIVGAGNAVVIVHANVTFNQVSYKSHTYQAAPGSSTGLPSSTQVTRTTSNSTGGAIPGGPAGQASSNPNTSTYAGIGANGGNSTYSSSKSTTNYDNSWKDTQEVSDPVQINGYSVGVFLNQQDKQLTPAVVSQIKAFVASAVGSTTTTTTTANNSISVVTVPFQQQVVQSSLNQRSRVLQWGVIGAGVLLLGGGWVIVRGRRRRRELEAKEAEARELEQSLSDLPESEDERMKGELATLANQKPDEFASLLRTWLAGD